MIIETTFIGDDGKPFIMDGATCNLVVEDKKTGDRLTFAGDITGNKVIHYYEMPKEAREIPRRRVSDEEIRILMDKWEEDRYE